MNVCESCVIRRDMTLEYYLEYYVRHDMTLEYYVRRDMTLEYYVRRAMTRMLCQT